MQDDAQSILDELLELLGDGDLEALESRFQELEDSGVRIEVEVEEDDPEFVEDPSSYTEVIQHCKLKINGVVMTEWETTYWGSYGGGGTGWWIDKNDPDLDMEIKDLLDELGLIPERPEVPEPSGEQHDD